MKEQLHLLWELQGIEQRKAAAVKRKDSLSGEEIRKLWWEITELTRNAAVTRERHEALLQCCLAREQSLSGLASQAAILEKRLYGGALIHNKEIEQVKGKYEALRRDVSKQEDELLTDMEKCEAMSVEIAQMEQLLSGKKREHQKKQQEASVLQARIDAEIAALESRAAEITHSIDGAVFAVYQKLRARMSQPVAKLANGVCGGCRMNIPTSQLAVAASAVVYCDNCGRMLYID
ncbi:MAG: C4-type zinc ribbon domain-containing protein [Negativicutes bacterium]|nr:C4-type zinc ribbon domain-containing protein [Negativicutes bacterium]